MSTTRTFTCGRRLLALLAAIAVLASVVTDTSAKYLNPRCPATDKCSCNFIDTDYEFDCPPFEAEITVHVKPSERVHVDCHTSKDDVYKRLPGLQLSTMQLGNISMVRIQNCPTPSGGTPYKAILDQLGVQHARTLMLSNGGNALVRPHLAGLHDLERLIIQKNRLTELPDDLFADVGNLKWLDMRSNSVHLTMNIFRDLGKLEFLELGYNGLKSLKPGMFHNQKQLRYLNLWGNSLKYLTQSELEGLSSVQDFDLSGNDLETMEQGVFDSMTGLSNVHLSLNSFHALPEGLLTHAKNLTRFTLSDNRAVMDTLPAALFADLPMLERVEVSCGLVQLPKDLFARSENIKNITLSENMLSTLPLGIFDGLSRVLDLDLSSNKLTLLEDGIFASLESVIVLRLSNNQLPSLSDNLLAGMKDLRELLLSGNQLRTIGDHTFRTNENLYNLQLANNRLSFVTDDEEFSMVDARGNSPFHYLRELRTLNLHNNSLISMLTDWSMFNSKLELLDLSYNNIRSFGINDLQIFAADGSTIVTNLTHNDIQHIDFSLLEHQTQRNITFNVHFDHNPIVCNCNLIKFVQYLHDHTSKEGKYEMRLSVGDLRCAGPETMVGRLVSELKDTDLLCPLDSPNSSAKHCPNACDCYVRPVDFALIVNCSHAGLVHVPALPNPTQFRLNSTELHITHNRITSLPRISSANRTSAPATGFDFVTEIHANHNNITQLHANNIPVNLRLLNMRHNRLRALNQSVLVQFNRTRSLHRIALGQNPWTCDCNAKDLLIYTQNHARRIVDMEAVRCADGSLLQENRLGDICPEDHTVMVLASMMMLLLGLSAGILVAFYYKYEQEVKVWLFAHNMLACLVTEHEVDSDKKFDAFVSYSHKDHAFVNECIVRELEKGALPYKLCLHERDWLVGASITQSIADSVECSRRTIIVLTKNFVESDWGKMEFRVAHKKALSENRARVIVIVCGELQDMRIDTLDAEMKAYLQTNTYIKWGDPWFWKKLRYALPHHNQAPSSSARHHSEVLHRMKALKGTVDDKQDLINTQVSLTPPALATPPAEMASHKFSNGLNGLLNGHVNGAFIINTNAKQSDV